MKRLFAMFMALALTALVPLSAQASGGHDLNGAELSILWVVPFVCMLLSIAIGPLAVPHFWHHHFGKVALFWGLAFLVPCAMVFGLQLAVYQFVHVLFMEYVPFIILLFALFTIAGGVRLKGQLVGTPVVNAGLLALGTILASWMGTTGAAMLLIRPLLRANEHRKYRMHIVIFFIFLVANIGGSLTPLGDPPLFLGFLKGVSFFWTTVHLFCKPVLLSVILLGIFFLLDTFLFSKEGKPKPATQSNEKLGLDGKVNLLLLIGVVISVLMSGIWKPESGFEIYGTHIELQNAARDVILLALAGASLAIHGEHRARLAPTPPLLVAQHFRREARLRAAAGPPRTGRAKEHVGGPLGPAHFPRTGWSGNRGGDILSRKGQGAGDGRVGHGRNGASH